MLSVRLVIAARIGTPGPATMNWYVGCSCLMGNGSERAYEISEVVVARQTVSVSRHALELTALTICGRSRANSLVRRTGVRFREISCSLARALVGSGLGWKSGRSR